VSVLPCFFLLERRSVATCSRRRWAKAAAAPNAAATPPPRSRLYECCTFRRAAAPSVPPLPVLEVAQLYERHGALGDDFTARVLNRAPLAVERNYALPGRRRAQKVVHRPHRGVDRGGRFQQGEGARLQLGDRGHDHGGENEAVELVLLGLKRRNLVFEKDVVHARLVGACARTR